MRETCILLWLYWLKEKNRVTQPAFHGSEARVVPRPVPKFFLSSQATHLYCAGWKKRLPRCKHRFWNCETYWLMLQAESPPWSWPGTRCREELARHLRQHQRETDHEPRTRRREHARRTNCEHDRGTTDYEHDRGTTDEHDRGTTDCEHDRGTTDYEHEPRSGDDGLRGRRTTSTCRSRITMLTGVDGPIKIRS